VKTTSIFILYGKNFKGKVPLEIDNSIIPIKLDLGKNDFGGMFSIYLGL